MDLALRIVKYSVGLMIVLIAAGFLLPEHYRVERGVSIAAPPPRVFALVAEQRDWRRWSLWHQRDPDMQFNYSGPDAATGATVTWQSRSEGNGRMQWRAVDGNRRIDYELTIGDTKPAAGEITFAPEGDGTRVTWTLQGDVGVYPVFRWLGLVMGRVIGPDLDVSLNNLKKLAETA
ncbi:MAG: SRPBCC family protein [Burkholderiales bacterium]|nr:SRPBCC family protein [Pseudomonadota bacterium]MCC7067756.1 SRPBCC family protein [Burkholderiales bacterium]